MMGKLFVALAAALICTLLVWMLREMMLTPVKPGKNTKQTVYLSVTGREPDLENNVSGLLWLNDNGILRSQIVINGHSLDDETRYVAMSFSQQYKCITFIENGEVPEWIKKMNC